MIPCRYHRNCLSSFESEANIKSARNKQDQYNSDKEPFNFVLRSVLLNRERTWNSTELMQMYKNKGGTDSNPTRILSRLEHYLKGDVYLFRSKGLATIVLHKSRATELLKLVSCEDEDETANIERVANKIKSEVVSLPGLKNEYPVLSANHLEEICSPTLANLLKSISPKFEDNLKSIALISGMISTVSSYKSSILQVALGVFVQDKRLIDHLYEYGITASYDEVRRFKISAASSSGNQLSHFSSENGLIQCVSDNFDATLSTQNGLKQTHSLASIIIQHNARPAQKSSKTIKRLKKQQLSTVKLNSIDVKTFSGPSKPNMPDDLCKEKPLPLHLQLEQTSSLQSGQAVDFKFIKEITESTGVPDYGGYNAKLTREKGELNEKSSIVFTPLINKKPSDKSTIYTAMCNLEEATINAGQNVTLMTCDQQLFRVMVDIKWTDPERWKNLYPRLGGMHWLVSFIGSVGKLMKNSGLDMILKSSFAGVEQMLVGKKFPMNSMNN